MAFDYFEYCKKKYDEGVYTKDDLKKFVAKGKLTPEQYKEITGEKYKA